MYDTPNNLIKKEGDFFRNMTLSTTQRPLSLRIFITIFSILILVLPGITFTMLSIVPISGYNTPLVSRVAGLVMGIFFITLGISIISKNIKKSS